MNDRKAIEKSATVDNKSIYQSEEVYSDTQSGINRLKQNPLLVFAMVGFTGIAGYKLFQIKQDRKAGIQKRLSLQLINTRLAAQGFVIGTLSMSVFYLLGKRIYYKMTGQKYDDQPNQRRYN